MDIFLLIIGVFLHFFALPLLIIALIWFFFIGRRLYREKKSLDAFRGNEAARGMAADRIKAGLIRALGIVLLPFFLGAAGLLLVKLEITGEFATTAAVLAAFAASGVFFGWSSAIKRRYNTNFKEKFVTAELGRVFSNLNYAPNETFDADSLKDLRFFRAFDGFFGNDLIAAEYEGLAFAQCDMGVQERYTVTVTDEDGHTRTEERLRAIFKGRGMRFDFTEPFRGAVKVLSKDFDAAVKRGSGEWQSVETELAEFAEHFEIYAKDPLDAMAVLTPQMIEGIFYLRKALDVPTALYFTGKSMFVFMELSREAFDVSSGKTLLEESRLLERDIALMTGFMDVMYFKRQASVENAAQPEESRATRDRAEQAASVAAAAGPSVAERTLRDAGRGMWKVASLLPKAVIAVYLISAVYGFINLPDEIAGGFTMGGDWAPTPGAQRLPTIGFLIVSGVFIVLPALGGHFFFSAFCLALYLMFMAANL